MAFPFWGAPESDYPTTFACSKEGAVIFTPKATIGLKRLLWETCGELTGVANHVPKPHMAEGMGVDTKGERFLEEAHAHDVSLGGAMLTGLDVD